MQEHKNIHTMETTNDIIIQELTDVNSGSTFVKDYLKSGFVSTAVDQLFYARHQKGLTQAQVAEQMNTKQAAIARLEADTDGSMSLRRYAEFALACEMVPLEITLVPIEYAHNFVLANPDLPLTQINYHTWLLKKEIQSIYESQSVQPTVVPGQVTITTLEATKPAASDSVADSKQLSLSVAGEGQSTTNQRRDWRPAA